MKRPNYGVIVGRFQVHELHEGHKELIRLVRTLHPRVIVLLGCSPAGITKHNPLSFEVRKRMLEAEFRKYSDETTSDVTILPLFDQKSDDVWSRELDKEISKVVNNGEVRLYGGRESFVPHYTGRHEPKQLEVIVPVCSGTEVRAKLTDRTMETADFRAGAIHTLNQMWDKTVPCVDVAIIHRTPEKVFTCIARKPDEKSYRFVGGHVEPKKHKTLEQAAKDEAVEESGLSVTNLKYLGSMQVDDWRYKDEEDKIMTVFFAAESMTMGGRGADDVEEVKWFEVSKLIEEDFEPEHRPLFKLLADHIKAEAHAKQTTA
jgi:bifunctional NMN adenylyltransferase/nudix hydrolase